MLWNKSYYPHLFTLILAFSFCSLKAQVNGNGQMVTKTFELEDVYKFRSNFYADIILDMNEESGITITAETNIINLIGIETKGGTLSIEQKKWIEPSKRIKIIVGVPYLESVVMDTHDDLKIVNVNGEIFKVDAKIGKVILSGEVDDLRITAKNGTVEASKLKSRIASVKIKGDGKAMLNVSENVVCNLSKNARLVNINEEAMSSDCMQNKNTEVVETRYINLKIKNNSWSRKHFVVVGPKLDGSSFSYGFPMMPGAVKTERWTVGTKVYKENNIGMRDLLVTLSEDNEGEVVELFEK